MSKAYLLFLPALACALTLTQAGCGGGGGTPAVPPTTGALQVQVTWPGRSRYVPPYANSLVCTLDPGLATQAVLTISRTGDSSYAGVGRFPGEIQAGSHSLTVTAFTATGGQGQSVAQATVTPVVVAGQTTTADVTADLTSTIANIVIDGQPLGVPAGGALQLAGHAVDAGNNTMLLPAGAMTWSIVSGSQFGSLTAAGLLTAGASTGTIGVSLSEPGAAKSQNANVTVTPADPVDHVVVDGQPLTVEAGSTLQLQGRAVDAAGNTLTLPPGSLTWTVTANPQFGSVTLAGLFTAIAAGTPQVTLTESTSHKAANANVQVTPLTTLYVADYYNNRLAKMTSMAGANWATLGTGAGTPACVAFDSQGRIYWTTDQANTICRADDIAGHNLVTLGTLGSGVNQFNSPFGIAIDGSNRIYVADSGNDRIVRVDDMSGTNWTTLGSTGTGTGQFTTPQGVYVGPSGKIYVADTMNFRVVRVDDMTGANWAALGGTAGNGSGQFDGPIGLFVDSSERIFVADSANDRIVRFADMSGSGWVALGSTGSGQSQFNRPSGVCADSQGRVYVADTSNQRVVRLAGALDGSGWVSLGGPNNGTGAGQFSSPMNVVAR